jgi:hypothetical protein
MSRIAPFVRATTSFASSAGGSWKCMPRSVLFQRLNPIFAWTGTKLRPCLENSLAHQARMNRRAHPRAGLGSITHAPTMPVSVKHNSFFACTISLGRALKSARFFEF